MSSYIGREFGITFNTKREKELRLESPVYVDYTKKEHTFIVAKSGSGKSYLAGVLAEELIKSIENYGIVIIDPLGVFVTLNQRNEGKEVEEWNKLCKKEDVIPKGLKTEIWIPAGEKDQYDSNMYDKIFSLRACDLSYGTLCYAFDMDPLEPQINLFRKAQTNLSKDKPKFTLEELKTYINDHGTALHFKEQTVEALNSKLDALSELKIIGDDGVRISELIREHTVAIFDLSMSSHYTSKLIVSFLAEQILFQRKKIIKKILWAKKFGKKEIYPDYIPPTNLIIDEAHNYTAKNDILKRYIKEGRNIGCILTAISQSPDLTKDIYSNISHLFVGQIQFDDDIAAIRSMLSITTTLGKFRENVKALTRGCFYYYNLNMGTERLLKVRARQTFHPAETELKDERSFISKTDTMKQADLERYAQEVTKQAQEYFGGGKIDVE